MSKKRMQCFILVLVFCMILMICYFMKLQQKDLIEYLSFVDNTHQLPITPYYDEVEDKYYLFLPSYASPEDIIPRCPSNVNIRFGGGDEFSKLPLSEDVPMILSTPSRTEEYTLQIWPCANLTTIYLETESGSMDYIHQDKENKEDASVSVITSDGALEFCGIAEINGRGNTTWQADKRPYNLTFSNGVTFGEFDNITKLSLLANAYDDSKLINSLAYHTGQLLEFPYCSPYTFVDLYANGEYLGLYGAVTKQEYKKHIIEDQIKAVFEVASSTSNGFHSSFGLCIDVMYGDLHYVQSAIQNLEEALTQQNWALCEQYIDLDSFAKKYALEEMFANWDLTCPSKYYYIGQDNRIRCMMPWDYDASFGGCWDFVNDSDLHVHEIYAYVFYAQACWYTHLLKNEDFLHAVVTALSDEYTTSLFRQMDHQMASDILLITSSYLSDLIRWGTESSVNPTSLINTQIMTESQQAFHDFFPKRRSFLIDYYSDPGSYCRVDMKGFYLPHSDNVFFFRKGTSLSPFMDTPMHFSDKYPEINKFHWGTEKGADPAEVEIINSDTVFWAVYDFD